MRHWHTCGAFGDNVYELSIWEWFAVLFRRELRVSGVVISIGKSSAVCALNNYAGSREQQLSRK